MDPIADMIIRIKNAYDSRKDSVVFPHSNIKMAILDVLLKNGYIKSFGKKGKRVVKFIEVGLLYKPDGLPAVSGVERVSKFSQRIYHKVHEIRKVKNGFGSLVLTTPKGIMTDKMAREAKVGGEALFKIW
jgi:small subunit ribosomal protein S8